MQKNYNKSQHLKNSATSCELCSISSLCVHNNTKWRNPSLVQERTLHLAKNELLVLEQSAFEHFFILHTGAVKSFTTTSDGHEQINGFYLPGDIVGLDCICTGQYNNSIMTLSNTIICTLKYKELIKLISDSENEQAREMVLNLMSSDIHNYQKLLLYYSQKKADEKVASFIYSLYVRYAKRGHTSLNIKLAMSRSDMANYLGLTIETISRIFTSLKEREILLVKGRYIFIKNLDKLKLLSEI